MKNTSFKIKVLTFIVILSSVLLPNIANAANGSLSFIHGTDGRYGYGTTNSTAIESTMKNVIYVSLNGSNKSYSNTAASGNSTTCTVRSNYLGKLSGTHTVDYYVNGILEHKSTSPWPFDFTGDWW